MKRRNATHFPNRKCNFQMIALATMAGPMLREMGLGSTELSTLVWLGKYWNDEEGRSYPSVDTMEAETLMHHETIRSALDGLEKRGVVKITKGTKAVRGRRAVGSSYVVVWDMVRQWLAEHADIDGLDGLDDSKWSTRISVPEHADFRYEHADFRAEHADIDVEDTSKETNKETKKETSLTDGRVTVVSDQGLTGICQTPASQENQLPAAKTPEPTPVTPTPATAKQKKPTTLATPPAPRPTSFGGPTPAPAKPSPATPPAGPPTFPDSLGGRLAAAMWHWFPSARERDTAVTRWPERLEAWVGSWPDHLLVAATREQEFSALMEYTLHHPTERGDILPRGKGDSAAWLTDPENEWPLRSYRADARKQKNEAAKLSPTPSTPALATRRGPGNKVIL